MSPPHLNPLASGAEVDYLKFDFCGVQMPGQPPENCTGVVGRSCGVVPVDSAQQYAAWTALSTALNKTGRYVSVSGSAPGSFVIISVVATNLHLWRRVLAGLPPQLVLIRRPAWLRRGVAYMPSVALD